MNLLRVLLCVLTTVSFASAAAFNTDVYKKHPKHVTFSMAGEKTIALIELDDSTTWKCVLSVEQESLAADIQRDLTPDQEVFLFPEIFKSTYHLFRHEDKSSSYKVSMTKETKSALTTKIDKIEKVIIEEGGWFTSEVYGYNIYLSDGSVWKTHLDSKCVWAVPYWKKNQCVIVSNTPKNWTIINVDAPFDEESDLRIVYDVKPSEK